MAPEKDSIDVEKIMEEIRDDLRKNGPYEAIPSFDIVPLSSLADILLAKMSVPAVGADVSLPAVYPVKDRNPVKKMFKKTVGKLVRCGVFPVAYHQSGINYTFQQSFQDLLEVVKLQTLIIHDLSDRVQALEQTITGGQK